MCQMAGAHRRTQPRYITWDWSGPDVKAVIALTFDTAWLLDLGLGYVFGNGEDRMQ